MHETIRKIKSKLNSVSFIPGFTLSPDEALFYVIITELRLAYRFPLIFIEKIHEHSTTRPCVKEYHTNGTHSEYVIGRYLISTKLPQAAEKVTSLLFRKEFDNLRITSPSFRIPSAHTRTLKKALVSRDRQEILRILTKEVELAIANMRFDTQSLDWEDKAIALLLEKNVINKFFGGRGTLSRILRTTFGVSNTLEALKLFWHYDRDMRKFTFMNFLVNLSLLVADVMGLYENEYLDAITHFRVIKKSGWQITLFMNKEQKDMVSENFEVTKNNSLNEIFELFTQYSDKKPDLSVMEQAFIKELAEVVKYREFMLQEHSFPERISDNKYTLQLAKSNHLDFIEGIREHRPIIGEYLEHCKQEINSIFSRETDPKKRIEKINAEILARHCYINLLDGDSSKRLDQMPDIIAKLFEDSIYFKVFDNVASKIYQRFMELDFIRDSNYVYDFTFYLLDKSHWFTWYIPSKKIKVKRIDLRSDLNREFFGLKRKFSWYEIERKNEQGLSEYVSNTGYPQYISHFSLNHDFANRLIRLEKKTWAGFGKFFCIDNKDEAETPPTHVIQIPIVYSLVRFSDENTKHLTEECDLYGIYPIYNFTFNIKADSQEPFIFFRHAFDFSFECMFVMSYLQKNQEDFLKSQLFEDATDSYKMAMEFEFPEKISLENEKAFKKRNSKGTGAI